MVILMRRKKDDEEPEPEPVLEPMTEEWVPTDPAPLVQAIQEPEPQPEEPTPPAMMTEELTSYQEPLFAFNSGFTSHQPQAPDQLLPPPEEPTLVDSYDSAVCYSCRGDIPIGSKERPLELTCPQCGAQSQLD